MCLRLGDASILFDAAQKLLTERDEQTFNGSGRPNIKPINNMLRLKGCDV